MHSCIAGVPHPDPRPCCPGALLAFFPPIMGLSAAPAPTWKIPAWSPGLGWRRSLLPPEVRVRDADTLTGEAATPRRRQDQPWVPSPALRGRPAAST